MNVLAMMGRSKSGKDTVGQQVKSIVGDKSVMTLAFADKLKLMCMDLYDLSYDDVFTEAGKDRVTDFNCLKCPACASIDCFEEVEGRSKRYVCRKCTAVSTDPEAFASKWTVRMILQHIGTEGCRRIDPYVWVNFAMRAANAALTNGAYVTPLKLQDGTTYMLASEQKRDVSSRLVTPTMVVITDCRFRSELDGVQRAGGSVWRLRRPATDRKAQGLAAHASENEMDTIPDEKFQFVIVNDGTLEQLQEKVKAGLEAFRASSERA